jgi:hypothetical protein
VNVLLSNTALHTWNLTVAAVRPVYSGDDAHTGAAISFTATTKSGILFEGTCVCIPPHWEADTVIRSLQQTQLAAAQGFMTLERVGVVYVKTYGPHWNASRGLWKRSYVLSVSPRHGVTLTATLNSSGCAKLRTEGYWADSSSWVGHAVSNALRLHDLCTSMNDAIHTVRQTYATSSCCRCPPRQAQLSCLPTQELCSCSTMFGWRG